MKIVAQSGARLTGPIVIRNIEHTAYEGVDNRYGQHLLSLTEELQ